MWTAMGGHIPRFSVLRKKHNLKFSFDHPLVGVSGNFILSRIAPEIEGQ